MAKILVVEDYPDNLALMTYILEAAGHEIAGAMTGTDALARAEEFRPEIVVLDVQLPDMDGYTVLARLRTNPDFDHVPVVAVTAYAMVGDREDALAAGFDGYLPKPIAPRQFAATIVDHLTAGRARTQPVVRT